MVIICERLFFFFFSTGAFLSTTYYFRTLSRFIWMFKFVYNIYLGGSFSRISSKNSVWENFVRLKVPLRDCFFTLYGVWWDMWQTLRILCQVKSIFGTAYGMNITTDSYWWVTESHVTACSSWKLFVIFFKVLRLHSGCFSHS